MAITPVSFLTGYRLFKGEDLNNNFAAVPSVYRASASLTKNASATYGSIAGLSASVPVGTFQFVARLPSTVASGTAGIKYCFAYSGGLTLSAIDATGRGFTASAVAVQHTTTTTSATDLFTEAAVVIYTEITGTMVVSAAGTLAVQMAQNTSNASDTVALLGGSLELTRIAF